MSKFELSLSPTYVQHWTYLEAIRELLQNAIDSHNEMDVLYDGVEQRLIIRTYDVCLDKSTLLLGATSKADDASCIGQFGEGYKIALLVLNREGRNVEIYNGSTAECWHSRIMKSRKYNSDLLVVEVEKPLLEQIKSRATDPKALEYHITSITQEEYDQVVANTLQLQSPTEVINVNGSQILLDPQYKGRVYMGGLFVCEKPDFTYGYNFATGAFKLDRDRKFASTWDISWEASKLWAYAKESESEQRLIPLVFSGSPDTAQIQCFQTASIKSTVVASFKEQYGTKALPVRYQSDVEVLKEQYGPEIEPIIVSDNVYQIVRKTAEENLDLPKIEVPQLSERFKAWYAKYWKDREDLEETAMTQEFAELVMELEFREGKSL